MKLGKFQKHEYFCIRCSEMEVIELPYEEPPAFLEGRECHNCSGETWAYSPPATNYQGDI